MALTESYMLPLGTSAPDFKLYNSVLDSYQTRDDLRGQHGTLVIFMCNHCPYVIHLMDAIVSFSKTLKDSKISTIAISSNTVTTHPQDGPEEMKTLALEKKFDFPYLYDETQEVAKAYQAACTPDFYLFDKRLELFYRGRFDASRPNNEIPITGSDIKHAFELMKMGETYTGKQYPSMGCNIKWLPSNVPS